MTRPYFIQVRAGFTLIELVVVIVVMSIVSLAGVEIIRATAKTYDKMLGRQKMGNSARLAVDRISRELRHALPGTVRVDNPCLEFIPINAAGTYIDVPVEVSASSFQAIPLNPGQGSTQGRVAVYPVIGNIYDLANNVLSASATIGAPDVNNEIKVTLSSSHQFPFYSPSRRFFLVADPVSFCVDGNYLFRYENYGVSTLQPGIASLPPALPGRALLVDQVGSSINPFSVSDSSMQRNAIVKLNLIFDDDGESVTIVHEVQLRNVP